MSNQVKQALEELLEQVDRIIQSTEEDLNWGLHEHDNHLRPALQEKRRAYVAFRCHINAIIEKHYG